MARNNETTIQTNETATALYKVGYTYLSKEGYIRAGAIVIDTTSAEKATEEAAKRLANTSFRHVKISKVSAY